MGFWRYTVFALLLSCTTSALPLLVSAQTINLSNDPVYAEDFSFYCPPYKFSFKNGYSYLPLDRNCIYSIPTTVNSLEENIVMSLYEGTLGEAILVRRELIMRGPPTPTLVQVQHPGSFDGYHSGDEFFATVFPSGPLSSSTYPDLEQFHAYFTTGSSTGILPPNQNYRLISWKWGPKPVSEYDPVIVIPGILGSWIKNGQWVIDPVFHIYDNLTQTLVANGYASGVTLFTLPYNWTKTNVQTVDLLKEKIQEIKSICNCSRVDIIAHSMGGLIAQQYLQSDDYGNDVDQIIFVGTPHLGAPLAYPTWEGGEVRMFGSILDGIFKAFLNAGARQLGYENLVDFIHSQVVSVGELLPTLHNYLSRNGTELTYPDGYPRNIFLENLIATVGRIVDLDSTLIHIQADNKANNTIESYSVGDPSGTVVWEHGRPLHSVSTVGDGTVPHWSSQIFSAKIIENTDHTKMVSAASSYIFEELNKKEPSVTINDPYLQRVFKNALFIKVMSPIDIQIIAPDGKRLGRDFSSNTELSEIPDSFYSGFIGDDEYAIILDPLPGAYKIQALGTGTGSYTLFASQTSEATTTQSEVIGTTTPMQYSSHTLTLSATTTNVVIVKDAPTSTPTTITPDTCVTDMQTAYNKKWITKKPIYNELIADCKLLKVLFTSRDKAKTNLIRTGIVRTIKITLDRMDQLAKDKSNTKEGREIIYKNTSWFRAHEL